MTGGTDWQARARALADQLTAAGALAPDWYKAFASTPRHVFVPCFYADDEHLVDGTDPVQRDRWLDAVYSDTSLTTRQATAPGTDLAWPTSSTTMPSLMARMLTLLNATPGSQVLEIGTGTGYNTALLCHRLGDANVTSIDIDPDLVDAARTALAEQGYRPRLATGDGAAGVPAAAPYERILATAAVPTIPPAWIEQLAPDGLIVADLRGDIASSLAIARRTAPGRVEGRFHIIPGHFMWLRAAADNPLRDGGTYPDAPNRDQSCQTTTRIPVEVFDDSAARFVIQLYLPDARYLWCTEHRDVPVVDLATTGGGWVRITATPNPDGGHTVIHGGPDAVRQRLEAAVQFWTQHGRPAPDRFGFTTQTEGSTRYWLDNPTHNLAIPAAGDTKHL